MARATVTWSPSTVTFQGARLKGKCDKLILPLGETRIIFEDNVEVVYDRQEKFPILFLPTSSVEDNVPAGSALRGGRIVWEMPAPRPEVQVQVQLNETEVRPATFQLPMPPPLLVTPPVLGGPK